MQLTGRFNRVGSFLTCRHGVTRHRPGIASNDNTMHVQCMCQPQEAVQTYKNQTILQRILHQVNAHTPHIHRDAAARTRSSGG